MYQEDGRPAGYDFQPSGIAGVTIRGEQGPERLLSRENVLRIIRTVEREKAQHEKKDK